MKIVFANQLRAIAALSVVLNHYWGIFFVPAVLAIVGVPASFVPLQPAYTRHVLAPGAGGFLYGAFGVAVFFLISGFVIPVSLRNLSTGQFLVRRFFRIYPVYWFCLLISLVMYVVSSRYWSTPLSDRVTWPFVTRNLPLLHSAAGIPSLDFVCWSLAVEVKFYLVFALITLIGKSAHKVVMLSIGFLALCCVGAYVATHGLDPGSFFSYLISDTKFMSFMFLGCLFYYVLYHELDAVTAFGYGLIIFGLFVAIGSFYEQQYFGPLVKNYTYALVLFWVCYLAKNRFRKNRILDFLADISFPLYLVHSMIGYVTMPILIDQGMPYGLAWLTCVGVAVLVACLVHTYVELPVNAFGKKLTFETSCSSMWRGSDI
ncbi:peptidoglycan/LPS O-acetylase OafA/YrhL [Luteibacter sp. OK325]|uniref:acyltransferase family protein n=1 Tax=Luteibacter sp. OK325 TaxID=2135670 RepID=UPI000D35CD67|nr:acyltransferase [Luteibacter sp. OK325]PTR34321.1 peptidoglycan/LPS O-acetylase OafA/YrhL [Luteibacter sp. OK325]